ncbi:PIG-L family deacetylase [Stackebrandtia nassauensis]|uniref:LmbE family protein n=1 Tax=Stackebrandtia nassauensis (strain DSM 44728 / CIP 108903 / NRRL B-16338 / NBRC 102104 / LLR-40K-21) TaxID=446470 RepID=D3PXX6_STANL|nr:PIG-L family deacetylase [Stackebrandtia nassauensis]ADD45305.1 LmbE family protein [Stackebrandtia nassauensis DSM 44728]
MTDQHRVPPQPGGRATRFPVKRRVVLGTAFAGGAVATAGLLLRPWQSDPAAGTDETGDGRVHMQIVAHPDDDLYFFNPDVAQCIRDGKPMVTVCITCGEGDGRNGPDTEEQDYESYVAARYNGLRAAHADMTLKKPLAEWTREKLKFKAGPTAELATLKSEPRIQLVFLNLWSNAEKPGVKGRRLKQLWEGETDEHETLVPAASPIGKKYGYDRETLLKVLAELLDRYNPVVVRTMDPDPDAQEHDAANPRYADQKGYSDHEDHTPAGLFAWEALRSWWKDGNGDNTVVESYRGYYGRRWPRNLSAKARKDKGRTMNVYAWRDERECGDPNGCGDLNITGKGVGTAYGASTTYRYSGDTGWLRRTGDKRLFAALVRGGRAVQWLEPESGSDETNSFSLVGTDLMLPSLNTCTSGAGVWHTVGVTAAFTEEPGSHTRNLLVRDFTFTGATGQWRSLGNPDADRKGRKRRGVGMPVAVAVGEGRLLVAARNYDRSVSVRHRTASGSWDDWKHLDGPVVQDGLSAVSLKTDTADIFASAADGVVQWHRDGGSWDQSTLDTVVPAGPPTAVALPDSRVLLLVREAETARLFGYVGDGSEDGWKDELDLGGDGGVGSIAALAPKSWSGRVGIAVRNDAGTVSVTVLDTKRDKKPKWRDGGPVIVHMPSLALDGTGRLTAGAIDADGRLHLARQAQPGIGAPENWTVVAR